MAVSWIERKWRRQWWWFVTANCASLAIETLLVGAPCGLTILTSIGTLPRIVLSLVGALRASRWFREPAPGVQRTRVAREGRWMREAALAVIVIGGPPMTLILGRENTQVGQQNSAVLVEAIEQYHSNNGTYPPDLAALVPGYIEEIPKPCIGPTICDFSYRMDRVYGTACLMWPDRRRFPYGGRHWFAADDELVTE